MPANSEKLHPDGAAPRNRILAALPAAEWERIAGALEPVQLETRKVLIEPNRTIDHVWFPETAVISVLGIVEDGSAVETATIGNEGMVGVPAHLGAMRMAAQAFAQVPGAAYRMDARALADELRRGGELPAVLGRYTQALFTLVAQSSACNRKHSAEQRCARWLLMTHDRVEGDTFALTHLFLSQMLGVRRATVSEIAAALQARGVIDYTRGAITVTDRAGLEAAACACYAVIRNELERMLGGTPAPDPLDRVRTSEGGLSIVGDGAPEDGGPG